MDENLSFRGMMSVWANMVESNSLDLDSETYRRIITEDKEGRNINKAERWIKQNHPEVIGRKLDDGTTITPRALTHEIRNMIPSSRLADCKFLTGVTRLYFEQQIDTEGFQRSMSDLNKILKILATAHAEEYDGELNGLSLDELKDRFGEAVLKDLKADKEEIGKLKLIQNDDYEIVPIRSYEEAKKYSKYVDWCITRIEDMYESYTKNGLGLFYFCLRKGFEKVKDEPGEDAPLDDYGKSMIAVCVNDDGSLNTCTSRWNHDHGGNDSVMTTKEISELIGADFYKTFKPRSPEELIAYYRKNAVEDDDFSKFFGAIAYQTQDMDETILYVKVVDGDVVHLTKISDTVAFMNGKFVTIKDGKFVEKKIEVIPQNSFKHGRISSVNIPPGVKRIEYRAFSDSKITRVTIPDGVELIEQGAFCYCRNLKEINVPGTADLEPGVFSGCYSLMKVTLGDGLKTIPNNAFSDCNSLENITIPDSVNYLGFKSFYMCHSLKSFRIPSGVNTVKDRAFEGCTSLEDMIIPSSVNYIENYAFAHTGIKTIDLPDNLVDIGTCAFNGCINLKSVRIPDSVVRLSIGAFYQCIDLETAILGSGLDYLDEKVFAECHRLKTVILGDKVNNISANAFYNCESLENIEIPKILKRVGPYAFSKCNNLMKAELPEGLLKIEQHAFDHTGLEEVIIPSTVKIVMRDAFAWCPNLRKIVLKEGVEEIGDNAFITTSYPPLEVSLSLPSTLKEIGKNAFAGCKIAGRITIPEGIKYIGDKAFEGTDPAQVDIPKKIRDNVSQGFYDRVFGQTPRKQS